MAQSWSLRYPLIDGQGNFGNEISEEMLFDLKKDTVDRKLNFDSSCPTVILNNLVEYINAICSYYRWNYIWI